MGAKQSTANGGHQSPRARTFSTSSSSDVVSTGTSFNILRAIPGMHVSTAATDRQRARSLSSVPDLQGSTNNHDAISIPATNSGSTGAYDPSGQSESGSNLMHEDSHSNSNAAAAAAGAIALGRVYTATSLPSHIWSLNGKFMIFINFGQCVVVICVTLSHQHDESCKGTCVYSTHMINPFVFKNTFQILRRYYFMVLLMLLVLTFLPFIISNQNNNNAKKK